MCNHNLKNKTNLAWSFKMNIESLIQNELNLMQPLETNTFTKSYDVL